MLLSYLNKSRPVKIIALCCLLSAILYFLIGYVVERHQFVLLFLGYTVLFFSYLCILKLFIENRSVNKKKYFWLLIGIAIFFRALLLFYEPNLSDDYHRFYWDGLLCIQNISPYAYKPIEIMFSDLSLKFGLYYELYEPLNSKNYYSVYPAALQWVFSWAANLAGFNDLPKFVLLLKTSILVFEIGTIVLLIKILGYLHLPISNTLWYALNPLVIIELTGNIHFEAYMIFFVLLCFYLLYRFKHWRSSMLAMALAFSSKLIPLIFLPFFIKRMRIKRFILYSLSLIPVSLFLFFKFIDPLIIKHIFESIGLYYNKFEFNASLYYVLRWIGFKWVGWNMIAVIGKLTAVITLLLILLLAFFEKRYTLKSLLSYCMITLTIYLLFANIVHPWYITPLIAFTVIAQPKYVVIWSWLIVLSYYTYSNVDYAESMLLVAIEYISVFGFMWWEFKQKILQLN